MGDIKHMSRLEVLQRLAYVGPEAIAKIAKPGPHCVLASRVGQMVLDRFHVSAEPFPVELHVWNAAWDAWALEGFPGGVDEQLRRRAHMLTNSPTWDGGELPGVSVKHPWAGHLVLDCGGWLLDLDLGSMRRPAKGIYVPNGVLAKMSFDRRVVGAFTDSGQKTHIAYQPLVAPFRDEYALAKDWTEWPRYRDLQDELADLIMSVKMVLPPTN